MARRHAASSRAPRDINLSDNEENIIPNRTRTNNNRILSAKQKEMNDEQQQQQIKALQKQLKTLQKTSKKKQNTDKRAGDDSNNEEEYETEEEDPPQMGYFAASAKSLGTFSSATTAPRKRLRKHGEGSRPPLDEINMIFNSPADVFGYRGRSSETTPLLHSRSRSSLPGSSPPPQLSSRRSPSSLPSTDDISHGKKRARSTERSPSSAPFRKVKKVEWNNNKPPTGRPKARDYAPDIYHLILVACREFSVRVCTEDPLPSPETQITWASQVWENSCKKVEDEYELTDRIVGLIKARTSNARATIKDAIRPKVQAMFKFVQTDNPSSKQGRRNKKQYEKVIKDNTYLYKDMENMTGLYETKLISEGLQAAWFKDKKSFGVEFSKYFDPVALVTIALILTAVDFVLGEWSTGVYIKATFDETTNGERFKSHLKGVTEWRNDNPEVVDKICQKLFKRALRNAGATVVEHSSGLSRDAKLRAKLELAARTGDTDSEEEGSGTEDGDEEDGRYDDEQGVAEPLSN